MIESLAKIYESILDQQYMNYKDRITPKRTLYNIRRAKTDEGRVSAFNKKQQNLDQLSIDAANRKNNALKNSSKYFPARRLVNNIIKSESESRKPNQLNVDPQNPEVKRTIRTRYFDRHGINYNP